MLKEDTYMLTLEHSRVFSLLFIYFKHNLVPISFPETFFPDVSILDSKSSLTCLVYLTCFMFDLELHVFCYFCLNQMETWNGKALQFSYCFLLPFEWCDTLTDGQDKSMHGVRLFFLF